MSAHIRYFAKLAVAAAASIVLTAVLTPPVPAAAAPSDGCMQALAYEKAAASDSVSRQAAYDSAVAGLTANQRCADSQMHLVNEAYLLSMRAGAEHELKIGDWKRDLTRANMLLEQCTSWPGLKGTKAGNDCLTQWKYNVATSQKLNATPAPAVSTAPAAAPTRAPGAAAAPPPPPLPAPAGPNPSPTPRR